MMRDKPDIDNNSALITWKSGATSRFAFQETGDGVAPFLEITYTAFAAAGSPAASFTSNVTDGIMPLPVHFTDTSTGTGPLSYAWDFDNNGVIDSTVQNPVFTYTTAGTYTVKLTVSNSAGSNSATKTITVTTGPVAPTAVFSTNVTGGTAPLAVKFTDASTGTGPLSYAWVFGDGGVSAAKNPTHTFDTPGTYTVSLTVQNAAGIDSEIKTGYITVSPSGTSPAGIALTFDDNSVDAWFEARSIFQQYNAHATFFISNFNNLNQDQINKLKTLQADGHEIAFHGYNHEDVTSYLQSHSLSDYINNEIIQGIDLMKSEGFNPVDFAFPYGTDDPEANEAMKPYFLHMRDTYYDWDNTIYYEYGSNTPYIAGIGIDDNTYGNSLSDIYAGISTAKQNDRIVIFYGHTLVSGTPRQYETSYTRLENILQYASDNNMRTYTIAEIH
jgi:PKD repeat protein